LTGYAVGVLPKLRLHEENVLEELSLDAKYSREITEILKMKRNSLWIGRAKKLVFAGYAVGILPKLRLHEESVMEELSLFGDRPGYTTRVLNEENNSIWVGKVERLKLEKYAIQI
ncbi:MAG: uncharacterized protein A8A55_1479, partial [Amphiamblys sp. WSBS2006]